MDPRQTWQSLSQLPWAALQSHFYMTDVWSRACLLLPPLRGTCQFEPIKYKMMMSSIVSAPGHISQHIANTGYRMSVCLNMKTWAFCMPTPWGSLGPQCVWNSFLNQYLTYLKLTTANKIKGNSRPVEELSRERKSILNAVIVYIDIILSDCEQNSFQKYDCAGLKELESTLSTRKLKSNQLQFKSQNWWRYRITFTCTSDHGLNGQIPSARRLNLWDNIQFKV